MADVEFFYDPSLHSLRLYSAQYLEIIRLHFSFPNEAKKWVKNPFKRRYIPDRIFFIQKNGKFDHGLLKDIVKYCKDNNYNIIFDPSLKILKEGRFSVPIIKELNPPLRDYQRETVENFLKLGRGLALLATGAGKTLTVASLIYNIIINNGYNFKNNPDQFVLLVPNIGLLHQTVADFVSYGLDRSDITIWCGGEEPDQSKKIIVCSNQILLSECSDTAWIEGCRYLIVDEVHGIKKDNEIFRFVKKCKTWNKFGFTGTMPNHELDRFNLLCHFGEIVAERSSDQLREQGTLTDVEVKVLKLLHTTQPIKPEIKTPTAAYESEVQFVLSHDKRNQLIARVADRTGNSLILVDRLEHGDRLLAEFAGDNKVFYITGEMPVKERQAIIDQVECSTGNIVIAIARIFSVGINIKNLHQLIFGSTSKSETKVVQSIGRILRKHPSKNIATVIDVVDDLQYSSEHFERRQEIYLSQNIPITIKNITI